MQQLNTPRGIVTVQLAASSQAIAGLGIDSGLGFFWHNRSELQHQALIKTATQAHSKIALAVSSDRAIVGFIVVLPADPDTRWGRDRIEGLFELGGIEVSRAWRGLGISRALLAELFGDGVFQRDIVIATGYRWCWDYETSGMTVREYRDMLHRMMVSYGFQFYDTDEPNIAWYPENALVARIGPGAPESLVSKFKDLLFENLGSDYSLSEFIGR